MIPENFALISKRFFQIFYKAVEGLEQAVGCRFRIKRDGQNISTGKTPFSRKVSFPREMKKRRPLKIMNLLAQYKDRLLNNRVLQSSS